MVQPAKLAQRLVIVRRDQFATFAVLAQAFADEPHVRLIWDRRCGERRRRNSSPSLERRRGDRRSDEATWARKDYLLLTVAGDVMVPAATPAPGACETPPGEERNANEHVRQDLEAAVMSDLPVLMSGGERVSRRALARRIHRRSRGADAPFTILTPQALAGSSSPFVDGRTSRNTGSMSGTFLIEEIGDWTLAEQAALLKFLETPHRRTVASVNGRSMRILSGTDYWLVDLIAARQFREDLFYRLNVIHVVLPSGACRGEMTGTPS